jgi:hypothetical protein
MWAAAQCALCDPVITTSGTAAVIYAASLYSGVHFQTLLPSCIPQRIGEQFPGQRVSGESERNPESVEQISGGDADRVEYVPYVPLFESVEQDHQGVDVGAEHRC